MYCSTCGVAVSQDLSFCNYCGGQLNRSESPAKPHIRPETLVFGMLATFVFGMIAIILLLGMLKSVLQLPVEAVLMIAAVPFALILILETVFTRLLLRHKSELRPDRSVGSKPRSTNELDAAHPYALPEPIPSVTENTTRAFAPIRKDRDSQNKIPDSKSK